MNKEELENLVKIGQLKVEPGTRAEFDGLVSSARKRLADARNDSLSSESRFDLAYNAAHESPEDKDERPAMTTCLREPALSAR